MQASGTTHEVMPTPSTAKVRLRAPEPSDADILYKWENDPAHWAATSGAVPLSHYALTQFVGSTADVFAEQQLRLVIDLISPDEGLPSHTTANPRQPIGTVELFDVDATHRRAGVGIVIADTRYRKMGYATQALQALCDFALRQLNLFQLHASIREDNLASLRLFERCGFVRTGTRTAWILAHPKPYDEHFYQRALGA